MRDGFETRETWPFECLRCLRVWEEEFVVRHFADDHGNQVEIWLSSGVAVQPPSSGTCCPGCGAYHVTSFPNGYLARHPELRPDPEARPEVRPQLVPELGAVSGPALEEPKAPLAGAPLAGRLLVAIGVPVALFVGYELYRGLVGAAPVHH
ncbi:hypothetical protein ABT158_43515 [Nonomuraea sp. NPDC001636]|uniref:hypothetical protein n=1 Tax=Nonomuraea sp. NPDC001636 TaxID=3154391 RepID=UPI00332C938A